MIAVEIESDLKNYMFEFTKQCSKTKFFVRMLNNQRMEDLGEIVSKTVISEFEELQKDFIVLYNKLPWSESVLRGKMALTISCLSKLIYLIK